MLTREHTRLADKVPTFQQTPPLNFFFSFSPQAARPSGGGAVDHSDTFVSYLGALTFPVAVQEHRQEERQRHHEAQRHEDGGVHRGGPVQLICGENKRSQSALVVAAMEITNYTSGGC